MPRESHSFRMSEKTLERLEALSPHWEMTRAMVIEQLIKKAATEEGIEVSAPATHKRAH